MVRSSCRDCGWLINGSVGWVGVGSSCRDCVGGYVVVGGWFGLVVGIGFFVDSCWQKLGWGERWVEGD